VRAAVLSLFRHPNFKEGQLEWAALLPHPSLNTETLAPMEQHGAETASFLTPEKCADL
jgi:hypothetical protein